MNANEIKTIAQEIANQEAFKFNFLADGTGFLRSIVIVNGIKGRIGTMWAIDMNRSEDYTVEDEAEVIAEIGRIVEGWDGEEIIAELMAA